MKSCLVFFVAILILGGPTISIGAASSHLEMANQNLQDLDRLAASNPSPREIASFISQVKDPLPPLPVPPVYTEKGIVQAPNPKPTPDFPDPVKGEIVRTPIQSPRPVAAIVQENRQPAPVNPQTEIQNQGQQNQQRSAEVKRTNRTLDGPAVIVNQENIHVHVTLSASNNLGRKVALEVKPGEYILGVGTNQGWDFQPTTTKKVPQGYEMVKGREVKS